MPSERTLFYPLPLKGCGTGEVESLGSYAYRLAFRHQLRPTTFMSILLHKMPLEEQAARTQHVARDWPFSGTGVVAFQLLDRLEVQTGQDLAAASLSRFSGLFAPAGLKSNELSGRYCPECVKATDDNGLPFGQLLWEVGCVAACPRHGIRLRLPKVCDAPESLRLQANNRPQLYGVCRTCGSVGHKCVKAEAEHATVAEIWAATQVSQMLALSTDDLNLITPNSVLNGLRSLVDEKFGGKVVPPSLAAGLARATVSTWVRGKFKPTLGGLLQLCLVANCGLIALLKGKVADATPEAPKVETSDIASRTYTRVLMTREARREAIMQAIASSEPPSFAALCRSIGVSLDCLRKQFPDESKALAQAYKGHEEAKYKLRVAQMEAEFEAAALNLKREGRPVNSKTLQAAAGIVAYSVSKKRGGALRTVLARHATAS